MKNIRYEKTDNDRQLLIALEKQRRLIPYGHIPNAITLHEKGELSFNNLLTYACYDFILQKSIGVKTEDAKWKADIIQSYSVFIVVNSFDYTNLISKSNFKFTEKNIERLKQVNDALIDVIDGNDKVNTNNNVKMALQYMYDLLKNTKYKSLLLMNIDCPYCNIDEATTLDHYLPKSSFPLYSINPWNFIPVCSKCNSIKHSYYPKTSSDIPFFNPIVDNFETTDDNWLVVDIDKSNAVASGIVPYFSYRLIRPKSMSSTDYSKLEFTFNKLQLATRYARSLNRDLSNKRSIIAEFVTRTEIAGYFDMLYQLTKDSLPKNHWRSVAYKTIALNHDIQQILFDNLCTPCLPTFPVQSDWNPSLFPVDFQLITDFCSKVAVPENLFSNFCSFVSLNDGNCQKSYCCLVLDVSESTLLSEYIVTNKILPQRPSLNSFFVFMKNNQKCKYVGYYDNLNLSDRQIQHYFILRLHTT